jgi:hypothetical protein
MWITQKPKKLTLQNTQHFEEKRRRNCTVYKKIVFIFVEYMYKMQHLEVSGAVVPYIGRTVSKGYGVSWGQRDVHRIEDHRLGRDAVRRLPISSLRIDEKSICLSDCCGGKLLHNSGVTFLSFLWTSEEWGVRCYSVHSSQHNKTRHTNRYPLPLSTRQTSATVTSTNGVSPSLNKYIQHIHDIMSIHPYNDLHIYCWLYIRPQKPTDYTINY